jgi:hypothetical protein
MDGFHLLLFRETPSLLFSVTQATRHILLQRQVCDPSLPCHIWAVTSCNSEILEDHKWSESSLLEILLLEFSCGGKSIYCLIMLRSSLWTCPWRGPTTVMGRSRPFMLCVVCAWSMCLYEVTTANKCWMDERNSLFPAWAYRVKRALGLGSLSLHCSPWPSGNRESEIK